MLSEKSRPIIEATLPVVGAHLEEITRAFYADMFSAHPELLDGLFSRSNQRNGKQQQALAGSIAAFGTHLINHPGTLPEAVLARIAHKHASLGIVEDQYPIVYKYLFGAIAKILGDAVTAEVAEAWTEVYWLMADALIKIEKGLYARQANDKMWAPWILAAKAPAGSSAITLRFVPADQTPVTRARVGQYVSLRVQLPDDIRQVRQYTLSDAVSSTDERIVTVKLDEAGEVSPYLHHHLDVGDVVELSNPYGDISLADDSDAPLVIATAGIGCTPAAASLGALAAAGSHRRITVLHADRDHASWALRDQMRTSVAELPNAELRLWLEDTSTAPEGLGATEGRMSLEGIDLPTNAQIHLCGPLAFMRELRSHAISAGVPVQNIAYEVFGPDLWLAN